MRNLENFGVQEMSIVEQKNVDGGGFWELARKVVVAIMAIHEVTCEGPNDIAWHAPTSFHAMDRGAW